MESLGISSNTRYQIDYLMRILYDHQIFIIQQMGGISRYFSELIRELKEIPDLKIQASIKFSKNRYVPKFDTSIRTELFPNISFQKKYQIQNFLNRYTSQRSVRKGKFDLFHPTYYNPYYLSDLGSKPMVVTVYDMIHEKLPHHFFQSDKTSENKKKVIERADRVIAISQNTKDDLVELFGIREEKIDVIYLGNSLNYDDKVENIELDWLPEKYILYVGNRNGYKNFQTFLESVTPLLRQDIDLHLVCVGGERFQKSEQEFFDEEDIEERAIQISCSDSELAHIYKNCRCFVFPSLYEGFGLPILEAFAAECPVACSNCTSLPEVAGDAAAYFDPKSESEIREAVIKVVYDDNLRNDLIQKGAKQLEQFSWKKTALQTKEVYESLI